MDSISRNKSDECIFWNSKVLFEACCRRGIDPRSVSLKYYLDYLTQIRQEESKITISNFRHNKAYLIGKTILKPLRLIKGLFDISKHR